MEKTKNTKRNLLIVLAVLALVGIFLFSSCMGKLMSSAFSKDSFKGEDSKPAGKYFAILPIYDTIQGSPATAFSSVSYDHYDLLNYIDDLIYDDDNKGIMLDVDSGGGTIFHSDEMYLKLLEYKEKTGRPIYAYFESIACSGAYYISCTADYIMANRNCTTGSIGVIISYLNVNGLYEKLGIEEIMITSGDNKGMGASSGTLTDEQREILQAEVDEAYEQFVDIVAGGRDMNVEDVKALADGRTYTAKQALENGLIDEITSFDDAVRSMSYKTGADGYYHYFDRDYTIFDYLFYQAEQIKPRSDAEVINEMINSPLRGVPLYMYQ